MTTKSELQVTRKTHYVLVLLSLISVFNYIDRLVMSVLVQPIKLEFGLTDTMIGLLTGVAFAVFYTIFGIPLSRLSDKIGRKPVIACACLIWSIATMLSGLAGTFLVLLLLRIGVAIGEAGGSAPSTAMVSELYPTRLRSRALAVFGLGPAVGAVLGIGFGGALAEAYGWRETLVIIGAPGILLALLLAFTTRDTKQTADASSAASNKNFLQLLRHLFQTPAYVHIIATGSIAAITGYAIQIWTPSFLIRSYHMSIENAGMLMGIAGGLMAVVGTLVCGYVADKLSVRDPGWQLGTALVGTFLSIPLALLFYLWPPGTAFTLGGVAIPTGFLFYVGFAFFGVWWTIPCYGALSRILPSNMLAQGTAFFFMGVGLIGAGLGPVFAGYLSDSLASSLGTESLRYALVITSALLLLPCLFLLKAIPKYRMHIAGETTTTAYEAPASTNALT